MFWSTKNIATKEIALFVCEDKEMKTITNQKCCWRTDKRWPGRSCDLQWTALVLLHPHSGWTHSPPMSPLSLLLSSPNVSFDGRSGNLSDWMTSKFQSWCHFYHGSWCCLLAPYGWQWPLNSPQWSACWSPNCLIVLIDPQSRMWSRMWRGWAATGIVSPTHCVQQCSIAMSVHGSLVTPIQLWMEMNCTWG